MSLLFLVGIGVVVDAATTKPTTNTKSTTAAKTATVKVAPTPKSTFEIGGWIPYWRTATGTADVLPHLPQLTSVYPFVYTMKSDGTLYDAGHMQDEPWTSFIAAARAQKVRVIPTVMWGNGDAIHATLSNTKTRIALEDEIAKLVKDNNYDGIDIDFEAKHAETKDYFSLFLKGLYQRMGTKYVYCSIEARMPLNRRYESTPPPDATQYANDYVALNKYCDRVQIMAYDQGSIDVVLNRARSAPYVPVADPDWVENVVTLAAKTISKKKILIGIPTYGYEYSVTPLTQGYRYNVQWAFNPKYALNLAATVGVQPVRNSAGELSFIYKTNPSLVSTANTTTLLSDSNNIAPPSDVYSQKAIAGSLQPPFNIVWWSDAQAIHDKVALAQKLGVRGVAIFKFDGGEDQALWSMLPKAAPGK